MSFNSLKETPVFFEINLSIFFNSKPSGIVIFTSVIISALFIFLSVCIMLLPFIIFHSPATGLNLGL